MKKCYLAVALILLNLSTFSQKQSITWGEEFKLKKGSSDIHVIYTDKSGVYLQEGHVALKNYYFVTSSLRQSASLIKLDNNLQEVFRSDFNNELRGKEFSSFFVFRDKLMIVATEYHRSERSLKVFASEIDKSTGEQAGTWKSVTSLEKDEKNDEIDFKIMHNADSTRIILISTVTGKEKNTYQVQEFDQQLKAVSKPVIVSNEFEAKTYQLEDVIYTPARKIILVGRVFEFQEGKKKKEKFLDFANYNIRMYDEKGKQQNEINTNIDGKWLTSTKLILGNGKDMILAAFYANDKKKGGVDGLLVQRINPVTGEVLGTTVKQINNSMLDIDNRVAEEDKTEDEKESKAEKAERENLAKLKDEGEGFSRHMTFRNIFYTSDNGLVLLAEYAHNYSYQSSSYSQGMNGMPSRWTYYTNYIYNCGDIMMCKVDSSHQISWLQVVPKFQTEALRLGGNSTGSGLSFSSFFVAGGRPYYGGISAMQTKNEIKIFFNDNPNNINVVNPAQKYTRVLSFRRSSCFVVSLDELTGKIKRNVLFSNTNIPTAMPRLGSVIGEHMFLVGKEERFLGKTKFAVGKIVLK